MDYRSRDLNRRIEWAYWKWRRLVVLRWISLTVLNLLITVALVAVLDWRLLLPQWVRLALLTSGGVVTGFLFWRFLVHPIRRRPSFDRIARHIEQHHPELEDRLVTAVEFGGREPSSVSPAMLDRLIEDASLRTSAVKFGGTISGKATGFLALGSAIATILVLSSLLPHLRLNGFNFHRVTEPWSTPNPRTAPGIVVSPGDKKLPRGSQELITAQITGVQPERVTLYYSSGDTAWQKAEMDLTELVGRFAFNLFNVQAPTRYYVKADELLSDVYTLSVFDPPRVQRLDLTYRFPEYTGLPVKSERDGGDIWAPRGTAVTIRAHIDRAVSGGELQLGDSKHLTARMESDTVAVASLKVEADGFYRFSVWDEGGVRSVGDPEYFINVIPDRPPELTLLKPGTDRKATMIEEVPVRVQVVDDFGLASLFLTYAVNDKNPVTVDLLAEGRADSVGAAENARLTVEHTLRLEDLGVMTGDFLSYFVEAADRSEDANERKVDSDIYFLEVRPFEEEYLRPVAQQGGGMQGQSGFQLAGTQKEIITATWKLERRHKNLSPEAFEEDREALATTQKNLQEAVNNIVSRLQERSVFSAEAGGKIVEYLQGASEAMGRAVRQLEDGKLADALAPEKEAYHQLLRAEAEQRQRELSRSSSGGAAQVATQQELRQLFQEELDKIDNRYETLQQQQSRQNQAEVDEALQRVKELARRQEDLNRANRNLSRQDLSPEEMRRQIDQLRRRQEQLNRDTQQLARQMDRLQRDQGNTSSSASEDLRQASGEMSNASNSLRQDDPDRAAAKGSKALDRLQRIQEQLRQGQRRSLAQQMDELRDEVNRLQQQEQRLLEELEKLTENSNEEQRREASQALAAAKGAMHRDTQRLEENVQEAARSARDSKPELAREMQRLRRQMEDQRLSRRMAESEKLLQQQRLNSATEAERLTKEQLDRLAQQLEAARDLLAASDEERLQEALDRARSIRDELESLTRSGLETPPGEQNLAENEASRGGQEQNKSQPPQAQSQSPNQQGNPTGRSAPSEGSRSNERLDPSQIERLREGLWRGLGDLRSLGESIRPDTSLHSNLDELLNQWGGMVRTFRGGSPERLRDIEDKILVPLRQLEAEIEQRLDLLESKEKLFFARDEKIPPEYQELVEKYYEALSKADRKN